MWQESNILNLDNLSMEEWILYGNGETPWYYVLKQVK